MTEIPYAPLTSEERALLDDLERVQTFTSIAMHGRLVENVTLQGLSWEGQAWRETKVHAVRFMDCHFTALSFVDTLLSEVEFLRCSFTDCRFERSRVSKARFEACALEETYWRDASLTDCSMVQTRLSGGWFEDCQIAAQMRGGSVRQTRMSGCQVDRLQWTETQVEALRLSECKMARLLMQHCAVDRLHVLGGELADLLVYAGGLRDVKLGELVCQRVELEAVAHVASLYLNNCTLEHLALHDCGRVEDLYLYQSHVIKLSVHGGRAMGWITHSSVKPGSEIVNAVLQDFFWDDSVCEGLALTRVELRGGFSARNTRFVGLRQKDVRYPPTLEWVLDGATFEGSDILPGGVS